MTIDVKIPDAVARITMSGRFDFNEHRAFKEAYMPLLDNPAVNQIIVDLSKVSFMDSSSLGMLLLLSERAKTANKSMALVNSSDLVAQILEVANFSKIFEIKPC